MWIVLWIFVHIGQAVSRICCDSGHGAHTTSPIAGPTPEIVLDHSLGIEIAYSEMAKVQCVAVLAILVLVCTSLALARVNAARSLASILFVAQRYEPASSAPSHPPAGAPTDAPGPTPGMRGYQPSSAPSHTPAWAPSSDPHLAPYIRGYAPSSDPSYVPAGAPHLGSPMSTLQLASPASAPTSFQSPLSSPALLSGM